jgi:hypothetical protein
VDKRKPQFEGRWSGGTGRSHPLSVTDLPGLYTTCRGVVAEVGTEDAVVACRSAPSVIRGRARLLYSPPRRRAHDRVGDQATRRSREPMIPDESNATHPNASLDDAGARFRHLGGLRRTLGINGKQASLIWAGVDGDRRAWRTDVCFLRMRSSACRCRLDCGGSRFRPEAGASSRRASADASPGIASVSLIGVAVVAFDETGEPEEAGARPSRLSQRTGRAPAGGLPAACLAAPTDGAPEKPDRNAGGVSAAPAMPPASRSSRERASGE